MTTPRKRLSSGLSQRGVAGRREGGGRLARHLQPKGLRAKVQLLIPSQLAGVANARAAKIGVIPPRRVNPGVRFAGEPTLTPQCRTLSFPL